MRRTLSIAVLLGSVLAACSQSSPDRSAPGGTASTPGATPGGGAETGLHGANLPPTASLTVTDPAGGAGPFAIGSLEKLVVTVDAAHFKPGQHQLRVDVTAPGGTLYAQLPAMLTVARDRTGHATAALQVRGSLIESFRDAGSWQLVAYVDGTAYASASVDLAR